MSAKTGGQMTDVSTSRRSGARILPAVLLVAAVATAVASQRGLLGSPCEVFEPDFLCNVDKDAAASFALGGRVKALPWPAVLAALALLAYLLARGGDLRRTLAAWAVSTGIVLAALDLAGTRLVEGAVARTAITATSSDANTIVIASAEADFPGLGASVGAALLAVGLVVLFAARRT